MSKKKKTEKWSWELIKQIWINMNRIGKMVWVDQKYLVIFYAIVILLLSIVPFARSGIGGLLINELVDYAGKGSFTDKITILLAATVAVSFLTPMFYSLELYLAKIFYFYTGEKFELLLIKRKGEIDIASHEDPKINDLFNRVMEKGMWSIQSFFERQFFIMQNIIEVLVASIILTTSQWWVFLIIFLATIPELLAEIKYGKNVWSIYNTRSEVRRRFFNLKGHFQLLPELIELKLFQNTKYFLSMIKELFVNFQNEERKVENQKLRDFLLTQIISQSALAFATGWFVYEVLQGKIQIGTFTFILASIANLRQALSALFSNLGRQYQDSLFVKDVFKVIDIKPAIIKEKNGIILEQDKTPVIEFKNVSFAYPGSNKMALKDFSLKIVPGDKVALVGINGAGKTTFVKLLCRFYDPSEGQILINGQDLKKIDLESWWWHLGVLFQDYAHYSLLVKQAIGIGRTKKEVEMENIKNAAWASESNVFIEEWEKSYEQMLGKQFKHGVEPSIGQWQKLALARTFYRNPSILILDEPTSSIDAEAETNIFNKLNSLPQDRTVILISHRFSTVRQASKIVVIKHGKIIEQGKHEELLAINKDYARLFGMQAKGYR